MGSNRKDCPMWSTGYCRAGGAFCWDVGDERCDSVLKAYKLGQDAGFRAAQMDRDWQHSSNLYKENQNVY